MTLAALAIAPAYPRVRPAPALEPPYDDEPAPRALRLVPPHVEELLPFDPPAAAHPADEKFDRQPTPRAELPDPRAWAGRLIPAALEAMAGQRSVQQLIPWTDDVVYAQIRRAVRYGTTRPVPCVLRSIHVSEPADGVAEICAVVTGSNRTRAVAARLEGADGKWRCTALHLI